MRRKSKWLAVVLGFTIMACTTMGCGSSSGKTKDIVASKEGSDTNEEGATESGETKTSNEATESGETESAENKSEETKVEEKADVTIGEQVLVDQDGIKITATEYTKDEIWGDGIKLLVENNSDKDYTVGCDALIVNDYMISDLFVSEIAAGKKANESMYLSSTELEASGIDTVGKIEMYFHAYDDAYNNIFQNVYSEIQTSEYANMDTTPNDAGTELYNANGIRIVGKTVDENSFWGTAILLYCENTSGTNVGINVEDMSINGIMVEPIFSTTVYDGKKSIDDITLLSSDLEENGIESIESVELKFNIHNADTYETIATSEPVTFSAQ